MRFDLEVVAEDILPAVRSIVAKELSTEYGLNQQEIADKLGLTQPAVSQYLSKSRADQEVVGKLTGDPQVELMIQDIVSKAAKNDDYSPDIAQLIQTARDKGLFQEKFEDTRKL